MIGLGVISRVVFSRAGAVVALALGAYLAFAWVAGLQRDLRVAREQLDAAVQGLDAALTEAQRAVDRALEAQEREKLTREQLDNRLDAVRRSAGACLDQPLPDGLFE
jgi:predicted Holliday junction resolvase-like endonuclease